MSVETFLVYVSIVILIPDLSTTEHKYNILSTLRASWHNLIVEQWKPDNLDATEVPDMTALIRVAKFLGLDPRNLKEALTLKTLFAQGETVVRGSSNKSSVIYSLVLLWN